MKPVTPWGTSLKPYLASDALFNEQVCASDQVEGATPGEESSALLCQVSPDRARQSLYELDEAWEKELIESVFGPQK